MFKKLLLALVLMLGATGAAYADGTRVDIDLIDTLGSFYRPLPGGYLRVCTSPSTGQPCTPLANLYDNAALTGTPITNPVRADAKGHVTFYVANGLYTYEISGSGFNTVQRLNVSVNTGAGGVNWPLTSTTANPAAAGQIRLAAADAIDWRNTANNANLPLGIDGSDRLTFNSLILCPQGASTTQILFNSSGNCSGNANFTYNGTVFTNAGTGDHTKITHFGTPTASMDADFLAVISNIDAYNVINTLATTRVAPSWNAFQVNAQNGPYAPIGGYNWLDATAVANNYILSGGEFAAIISNRATSFAILGANSFAFAQDGANLTGEGLNFGILAGFSAQAYVKSGSHADYVYGVSSIPAVTDTSSTATNLVAFHALPRVLSSGVVTNLYHFLADNNYGTGGTTTNLYGYYFEAPTIITATNVYGAYLEDVGASQYSLYSAGGKLHFPGIIDTNIELAAGVGLVFDGGTAPTTATNKAVFYYDLAAQEMRLSTNNGGFQALQFGTQPVTRGGTGLTSVTSHYLMVGAGTSPVTLLAPGTLNYCLLSGGASADPSWGVCPGGSSGDVIGPATNTDLFVPRWNGANSKTLSDGLAALSTNTINSLVLRDSSGDFAAGTITAALTGNASTATALAGNPTDCGANEFANAIIASGNLTCAQPSTSNLSDVADVFLETTDGTAGAHAYNFSAATDFVLPTAAGFAPNATAEIGYNTTDTNLHFYNGANRIVAVFDGTLQVNGGCLAATVTGSKVEVTNTGIGCSGSSSTAFSDITSATNTTATMTVGTGGTITFSGSGVVNANQANGTTLAASSAADQALRTTASGVGSWTGIPDCDDSTGNHLNYDTTAHTFSCGNSGSGGPVSLTQVTALTTTATINNGNIPLIWNWQETTASQVGFLISENGASTSSGGILHAVRTVASSTLSPFEMSSNGNGLKMDTNGRLNALGTGSMNFAGLSNFPTNCTNQVVIGLTSATAWNCQTITSAYVNGSIATLTGGLLPIAQGGTNFGSNPVERMLLSFAGVNAGTAAPGWDIPASGGMTATPKTDGTNGTVQGTLQAAANNIAYATIVLPSDFVSFNSAKINFTTTDVTNGNTIIFNIQTACTNPNGTVIDAPAYNAANAFTTVTIGGGAVANALYSTTAGTVTGTGCAANYILHLKLSRSGSDTSTDTGVALTGALVLAYNGAFN